MPSRGRRLDAVAAHAQARRANQVEAFRRLVAAHSRSRLSVSEYATRLGITAGQLTRLCRETLGMSSLDVINRQRLHDAQLELALTVASIHRVAANLGFGDEDYFGRFFRRHAGMTPTAYRERMRHRAAAGDLR